MRTTASRIVYENRWMSVREDEIERADGSSGIYGVVEKTDFALVIPFDGDGLYLVEQYRYPVGARFQEFPQGSWESDPDADPLALARGELRKRPACRPARWSTSATSTRPTASARKASTSTLRAT